MIDVDYFKKINDTHGHLVGDQVLIEIARHFQSITRKVDIIARYGGEEFIILLPDTTAKDAFEFAERLRKRMDQGSFIVDKKSHPLPTISIGIASLNHKTLTLEALLNSADKALYKAKEAGRNTIVVQKSEDQKVLNITAS